MMFDIFCKVIDNHGDLGVCWRLCCELARRGQSVRLWVDDASALTWMAPQGQPGVTVHAWTEPLKLQGITPGEVLVEAFGCEVAPEFIAAFASSTKPKAWINLEYLSAEPYVERSHGLPSPVMGGLGKGLTKHFFYPGFTARTGGLLREADLKQHQQNFDAAAWLQSLGVPPSAERRISLFCYEPQALGQLLAQLQASEQATQLLVTAGRAQAAVAAWLKAQGHEVPWGSSQPMNMRDFKLEGFKLGHLAIYALPYLTQHDYDHLLWACDMNFVRGEDSVVRAFGSGAPLVWHIYPQDDDAHHAKLLAFLKQMQLSDAWCEFHQVWNGLQAGPLPMLDALLDALRGETADFKRAADALWQQDDLSTQLLAFVQAKLQA